MKSKKKKKNEKKIKKLEEWIKKERIKGLLRWEKKGLVAEKGEKVNQYNFSLGKKSENRWGGETDTGLKLIYS